MCFIDCVLSSVIPVNVSDMLGRRLEMESDGQLASDAHLCYIVSGNTEQLVASWDRVLANSASNNTLQVMRVWCFDAFVMATGVTLSLLKDLL